MNDSSWRESTTTTMRMKVVRRWVVVAVIGSTDAGRRLVFALCCRSAHAGKGRGEEAGTVRRAAGLQINARQRLTAVCVW